MNIRHECLTMCCMYVVCRLQMIYLGHLKLRLARERKRQSLQLPDATRRVMAAARARSSLLASLLVSFGLVSLVFVPAPRAESPSLRGLAGAASVVAAPGVASAADEYLNYNMTGEFTPFMVIGYFGLTTFLTAFAFGSYLVLTKLKII